MYASRPPANHALRQLTKPLQGHAIAQALFGLLAAVWDRSYQHVYPRAEALVAAVESGSLKGDLGPLVANLVETFLGKPDHAIRIHILKMKQMRSEHAHSSCCPNLTRPLPSTLRKSISGFRLTKFSPVCRSAHLFSYDVTTCTSQQPKRMAGPMTVPRRYSFQNRPLKPRKLTVRH